MKPDQDLEVGFESGKMMGGVSLEFMAASTSSENRPPHADSPDTSISWIIWVFRAHTPYLLLCLV